jgi:ribosome biogenesis GTPase A
VLNRVDQADPEATKKWAAYFRAKGYAVLESDAKGGMGTNKFSGAVRELLAEKLRQYAERGQSGRVVRVMILGIPNVGKSTFINKIAGRKIAKTEDRPGVTRAKQWVPIDKGLELLDTPGILWPKFEDQSVGLNLAYTGAVKDDILDTETLGCHLMAYLGARYPEALLTGYKLNKLPEREEEDNDIAYGYRLLEAAARRRGFLISGGEVDTERMAKILLDEFRGGKLGRFTLEMPE